MCSLINKQLLLTAFGEVAALGTNAPNFGASFQGPENDFFTQELTKDLEIGDDEAGDNTGLHIKKVWNAGAGPNERLNAAVARKIVYVTAEQLSRKCGGDPNNFWLGRALHDLKLLLPSQGKVNSTSPRCVAFEDSLAAEIRQQLRMLTYDGKNDDQQRQVWNVAVSKDGFGDSFSVFQGQAMQFTVRKHNVLVYMMNAGS